MPSGALKMRTARPTFQGPRWIPKGKAPRECVWQCWIYCSSVITPGKQLNQVNQLHPLISYLPETVQDVATVGLWGQRSSRVEVEFSISAVSDCFSDDAAKNVSIARNG
jgi:hypothetical protein